MFKTFLNAICSKTSLLETHKRSFEVVLEKISMTVSVLEKISMTVSVSAFASLFFAVSAHEATFGSMNLQQI